jgi:hypothetical protein
MISDQRIVFERLLSVIRSVSFPGPAVVQALDQEIQLITSMGAMLGGPYLPAINEQSLGISVPPCEYLVRPSCPVQFQDFTVGKIRIVLQNAISYPKIADCEQDRRISAQSQSPPGRVTQPFQLETGLGFVTSFPFTRSGIGRIDAGFKQTKRKTVAHAVPVNNSGIKK